jgi:hypothetical protein
MASEQDAGRGSCFADTLREKEKLSTGLARTALAELN